MPSRRTFALTTLYGMKAQGVLGRRCPNLGGCEIEGTVAIRTNGCRPNCCSSTFTPATPHPSVLEGLGHGRLSAQSSLR